MKINPMRFTKGDSLGLDPLKNLMYQQLDSVTRTVEHTVKPGEEGNPQLIAYDYYGTVELYPLILAYNGIVDAQSLYSGQVIEIPDSSQVLAQLKKNSSVEVTI